MSSMAALVPNCVTSERRSLAQSTRLSQALMVTLALIMTRRTNRILVSPEANLV